MEVQIRGRQTHAIPGAAVRIMRHGVSCWRRWIAGQFVVKVDNQFIAGVQAQGRRLLCAVTHITESE